jgi:hypothetical protein
VQRDLARLQTRVARLRIVVDKPDAEITVDGVSVGRSPMTDPVLVSAGRPQVRVTLAGHAPVTRVIEVAGMDTATVTVQLSAAGAPVAPEPSLASPPPRTSQHGDARSPHLPTTAWIATGVLAAGAGTTGALALWSSADLKKARESLPAKPDDLDNRSRRTRRLALTTDILLGATVVAAGVATVLTLTRPHHGEAVAVTLGPGGVGVEGSF